MSKHGLLNGGCCDRFKCKNADKKDCVMIPKGCKFVECNKFEALK